MTDADRAQFAADTAYQLRRLLSAVVAGDLDASVSVRSALEGAAVALEAVASDDPVAALDALADSLHNV